MSEKTLSPSLERLGIVKLQNFDIGDDQTGALDRRKYFRQSRNIAAREYVFCDPWIGDARRAAAADRVQERDAILREKLRAFGEKGVVEPDPDMFEHADRHDPIEPAGNIAIVQKLECDVLPAALAGAAGGALVLLL